MTERFTNSLTKFADRKLGSLSRFSLLRISPMFLAVLAVAFSGTGMASVASAAEVRVTNNSLETILVSVAVHWSDGRPDSLNGSSSTQLKVLDGFFQIGPGKTEPVFQQPGGSVREFWIGIIHENGEENQLSGLRSVVLQPRAFQFEVDRQGNLVMHRGRRTTHVFDGCIVSQPVAEHLQQGKMLTLGLTNIRGEGVLTIPFGEQLTPQEMAIQAAQRVRDTGRADRPTRPQGARRELPEGWIYDFRIDPVTGTIIRGTISPNNVVVREEPVGRAEQRFFNGHRVWVAMGKMELVR